MVGSFNAKYFLPLKSVRVAEAAANGYLDSFAVWRQQGSVPQTPVNQVGCEASERK